MLVLAGRHSRMALLQPLPDARLVEGVPALQRAGRPLVSIVLLRTLRLRCGQALAADFGVCTPDLQRPAWGHQQRLRIGQPQQVQVLRVPGPVQPQPLSHLMQRLLPLPLCRPRRACRTLPDNRCSPYGRGLLGSLASCKLPSRHRGRRLLAALGGLLLQATSLVVISAAVCMAARCRQPSLCWCGGHGRPAHSAVPVHALNLSGSCILHSMETGVLNLSGSSLNTTSAVHVETVHTRTQHRGQVAPYEERGHVQQWRGLSSYLTAQKAALDMAYNA